MPVAKYTLDAIGADRGSGFSVRQSTCFHVGITLLPDVAQQPGGGRSGARERQAACAAARRSEPVEHGKARVARVDPRWIIG